MCTSSPTIYLFYFFSWEHRNSVLFICLFYRLEHKFHILQCYLHFILLCHYQSINDCSLHLTLPIEI